MRIIILAAGERGQWDGPILKQLIPIGGKPLLERTVDQVRALGHAPIVATHWHELFYFAPVLVPMRHRWIAETMLHTRALWGKRTVFLHGDVVWHPDVLRSVIGDDSPVAVFGNSCEIYASSFDMDSAARACKAMQATIEYAERTGRRGNGRVFYQALCGFPLGGLRYEEKIFHVIPSIGTPEGIPAGGFSYVRDFDVWEQYQEFLEDYEWAR
jgi:hypothetical protein